MHAQLIGQNRLFFQSNISIKTRHRFPMHFFKDDASFAYRKFLSNHNGVESILKLPVFCQCIIDALMFFKAVADNINA